MSFSLSFLHKAAYDGLGSVRSRDAKLVGDLETCFAFLPRRAMEVVRRDSLCAHRVFPNCLDGLRSLKSTCRMKIAGAATIVKVQDVFVVPLSVSRDKFSMNLAFATLTRYTALA